MVTRQFATEEDLFAQLTKPEFSPVKYKHVKRGTIYVVISQGEYHLNTFSEEGSLHDIPFQGRLVSCEMQFSGDGSGGRYAGHITIYMGEDGKFWLRPTYEFLDGRFEKID